MVVPISLSSSIHLSPLRVATLLLGLLATAQTQLLPAPNCARGHHGCSANGSQASGSSLPPPMPKLEPGHLVRSQPATDHALIPIRARARRHSAGPSPSQFPASLLGTSASASSWSLPQSSHNRSQPRDSMDNNKTVPGQAHDEWSGQMSSFRAGGHLRPAEPKDRELARQAVQSDQDHGGWRTSQQLPSWFNYKLYKQFYAKSYLSQPLDELHQRIYLRTALKVLERRASYRAGRTNSLSSINELSDLTADELAPFKSRSEPRDPARVMASYKAKQGQNLAHELGQCCSYEQARGKIIELLNRTNRGDPTLASALVDELEQRAIQPLDEDGKLPGRPPPTDKHPRDPTPVHPGVALEELESSINVRQIERQLGELLKGQLDQFPGQSTSLRVNLANSSEWVLEPRGA